MKLRRWYFSANDRGLSTAKHQIKAAVGSAKANTDLGPICIYNGNDNSNIEWLSSQGVEVLRHEASFADALKIGYGRKYRIFSGHWLRVDIPVLEQRDEYVLYTDIDVIFLRHPKLEEYPEILGVVPEDRNGETMFNNGVMVMNVPALRADHDRFVNNIRERVLNDFVYPAHDQTSYNRVYRSRSTMMPPHMNWRPYWGRNKDATIVHFHGPKPEQASALSAGEPSDASPTLVELWNRDRDAYQYYGAIYEKYLNSIPG